MNLLDPTSVVSTLGLVGVLGIIFMETGLLIGLVFPGGEVVFLAGIAASGSGSGSNEAGAHFEGRSKLARDSVALFSRICSAIFFPS